MSVSLHPYSPNIEYHISSTVHSYQVSPIAGTPVKWNLSTFVQVQFFQHNTLIQKTTFIFTKQLAESFTPSGISETFSTEQELALKDLRDENVNRFEQRFVQIAAENNLSYPFNFMAQISENEFFKIAPYENNGRASFYHFTNL